MKSVLRNLCFAALLCGMAVGCDDNETEPVKERYLTFSQSSVEFAAEGESLTLLVSSSDDFTLSCDAEWLTVTPAEGVDGDTRITVTADENSQTQMRQAVIIARSEYVAEPVTLNVTQRAAKERYLNLSLSEMEFAAEGESLMLTVSSSDDFTLSCYAEWLTLTPAAGVEGDTEITVTAVENTARELRQATVVARSEYVAEPVVLNVTQRAAEAVLRIETDKASVSEQGGDVEIAVYANVAYTTEFVGEKPEWIDISERTTAEMLVLTVAANTVGKRSCGLRLVSAEEPALAVTLDVEQSAGGLVGKWYATNCGEQPYGSYYYYGENPCPEGYELPMLEDYKDLVANNSRYFDETTADNPGGVNGMWFGPSRDAVRSVTADTADALGCIFFPAAGRIGKDTEEIFNLATAGAYITRELESEGSTNIGSLYFIRYSDFATATYGRFDTGYRLSVRCIKKTVAE